MRWISLAEYLSSLLDDLQNVSSGNGGRESTLVFASDNIQAAPDTAISIGIVATELVLNALKHAYPKEQGQVRISLRARGSEIDLIVEDDGIGAGDRLEGKKSGGLGRRIIAGMADKLEGTLRYEMLEPGTRAILTFPAGDHIRIAG